MSAVDQTASALRAQPAPPKSNMSSHPCFLCGLMFAKKADFDHHESVFHNPTDKIVLLICDQCGKTHDSSTDLAEHQMEHDLALLLRALYDQECGSVDAQPQARMQNAAQPQLKRHQMARPPPLPQDGVVCGLYPHTIVAGTNPDQSGETNDINAPDSAVDVTDHQQEKSSNDGELESETNQKLAPEPMDVDDVVAKNDGIELELEPTAARPPIVQIRDAIPSATVTSTETVSTTPTIFSSSRITGEATPATQFIPKPPSTPIILSSVCPNCGGSYGKPWLLIEHMVDAHQAQMVHLQKKVSTAASATAVTSLTEEFADDCCIYCGATSRDSADNLSHVIRCHRDKLFECPEMSECDVCFEVLATVGPSENAAKRKFTIRVKIKRKPKL